jgi:CubicO group peptidase (beta-lactamase class C family)
MSVVIYMNQNKQKYIIKTIVLIFLFTNICVTQHQHQHNEAEGIAQNLELEQYLDQMSDTGFAFSVLVAQNDKIIHMKGYGWADSLKTKQTNERTLFNIASITKSFTAVVIFWLRDKGALALDDKLPKFFINVPKEKQSITVAQLLTHTSGLGQNYAADGITNRDSAVRQILKDKLKFKSGKDFSYSNENYELLGAIIEILTRQNYEDVLRRLIWNQASITDTKFWGETQGADQQIIAEKNRVLDAAALSRNWGYIASGGIYSNVTDLYRWFIALRKGVFIEPKSLEQMWTVQKKLSETGVAYGWFVSSSEWGKEIWTRGTEDWGHNGVLRWFPERNVVIIVLSNSGERGDKNITANRFISDGIAKIVFKKTQ